MEMARTTATLNRLASEIINTCLLPNRSGSTSSRDPRDTPGRGERRQSYCSAANDSDLDCSSSSLTHSASPELEGSIAMQRPLKKVTGPEGGCQGCLDNFAITSLRKRQSPPGIVCEEELAATRSNGVCETGNVADITAVQNSKDDFDKTRIMTRRKRNYGNRLQASRPHKHQDTLMAIERNIPKRDPGTMDGASRRGHADPKMHSFCGFFAPKNTDPPDIISLETSESGINEAEGNSPGVIIPLESVSYICLNRDDPKLEASESASAIVHSGFDSVVGEKDYTGSGLQHRVKRNTMWPRSTPFESSQPTVWAHAPEPRNIPAIRETDNGLYDNLSHISNCEICIPHGGPGSAKSIVGIDSDALVESLAGPGRPDFAGQVFHSPSLERLETPSALSESSFVCTEAAGLVIPSFSNAQRNFGQVFAV